VALNNSGDAWEIGQLGHYPPPSLSPSIFWTVTAVRRRRPVFLTRAGIVS